MNKKDAIKKWVEKDMNSIPQDWAGRLFKSFNGYVPNLPMWGTMWICNEFDGTKFYENSRKLVATVGEIQDVRIRNKIERELEGNIYETYEQYIDDEMSEELCVLDKDGNRTSVYVYELDGEYVIGVNGAGWNFYDGVWDRLYDVAELNWHTEK